jgi:maleylacetoacetate isomerase
MIELYDYFRSSACYRVRIVLNYKNISFNKHEIHLVHNGGEQHTIEYKHVNHQELVPALCINKDKILTQSLAIIEYLEEQYPTPAILPQDKYLRAEARKLAYIVACDIHPLNNLRVLDYLKDNFALIEQSKLIWYQHWLQLGLASFEHYITDYSEQGDFCLGREFSLADVCLIPQVYNALRYELPMAAYPRIMKVYNYCLQLPFIELSKP